jgi:hypothetical protein
MAAFELRRAEAAEAVETQAAETADSRKLKEECIIALKV